MARNEEKHFGRLNRLYLLKEKEEYEKANPKRPKLDTLHTPEDIQKWLPSIKKNIDFYLKKSQVTCYSDAHIEDCQENIVKLEKEFKAFVRKMKQLSPAPLEAIPWTNRPYKRKKSNNCEKSSSKELKRIATPILDKQGDSSNRTPFPKINWNVMNQPLSFSPVSTDSENTEREAVHLNLNNYNTYTANCNLQHCDQQIFLENKTIHRKSLDPCKDIYDKNDNQPKCSIVNYDSSDSDTS